MHATHTHGSSGRCGRWCGGLPALAAQNAAAAAARRATDPALTRVTRHVPPALPLDAEELTIERDSPAIGSLAYLKWNLPASGRAATVNASEIQGVCILACKFQIADADVRRALAGPRPICWSTGYLYAIVRKSSKSSATQGSLSRFTRQKACCMQHW